jgi:hypothetical protein
MLFEMFESKEGAKERVGEGASEFNQVPVQGN